MKYLWTWSGKFFGYQERGDLWTHNGKHVGKFHGQEVYGIDGRYLGEILNKKYLIKNLAKSNFRKSPIAPYGMRAPCAVLQNHSSFQMNFGFEDFKDPLDFQY